MPLRWFATGPIEFNGIRAFNAGDYVADSIVALHDLDSKSAVVRVNVPAESVVARTRPLTTSDRDTDAEREAFVPARLSESALRGAFETLPELDRRARAAAGSAAPQARTNRMVPVPSRPPAALSDAAFTYPRWISADGATLYGQIGPQLKKSTDDGTTWGSTVHTFPADITAIREMSNGELLVAIRGSGVAGELWRSTNGQTTFTKVLTASAATAYFHPLWGISVGKDGRVLVSEYGTKMPTAASAPRYVRLSEDNGATFRVVYDLGNVEDGHVHGCAIDDYWNRLWVVTGDSVNRKVIYSDDEGQNWETVSAGNGTDQMVGIHPMPDCILFTTDSAPNGIRRIWRTSREERPVIETAYLVEDSPALTVIGSLSHHAPGGPALFPFHRSTSGKSYLIATWDGVDFFELWRSDSDYTATGLGLQNAFRTASGKLVGLTAENSGSGKRLAMPAPAWRPKAAKYGAAPIRTFADPGAGWGAARGPVTAAAGLTDLDLRFTGTHPSWMPATEEALISRYLGSDGNREWWWVLRTDGRLQVRWYLDRTNATAKSAVSTVAPTTVTPGARVAYLRVTVDADNGAGGSDVKFWESTDRGTSWVQIGATVTIAGTNPLPSAAAGRPLIVGGAASGEVNPWTGDVYAASVMTGIDAPTIAAMVDFNDPQWALGDTPPSAVTSITPSYTDPAGNVWELLTGCRVVGLVRLNTEANMKIPTITGSRGTEAATVLRQVLTALHSQGLVTDQTTA